MNILITGGAGFIGSNLAIGFKTKYSSYNVTAVDNLSRRGSELNIEKLINYEVSFCHGDIRNPEDLESLNNIDVIIDASAEPSVLAGISSPIRPVLNNNLLGSINVLELAKREKAQLIFLSTSRVYPIRRLNEISYSEEPTRFDISEEQFIPGISREGITEEFPLEGSRSFYGSTKLASELLIEEYHEYCGLQSVVNRCGVVSGPGQMGKIDQGVVVLWMAKHFWKKRLSYIGFGGEGKQVRDFLHVDDLFDLIDYQCHHIEEVNGDKFNLGGGRDNSSSLLELTKACSEITGNSIAIDKVLENRETDVRIYISDNSKIAATSNWSPKRSNQELLQDVFIWLKENEDFLKSILG